MNDLAEAPAEIHEVKPEEAEKTEGATPVSVQVTTPEGQPGLVREDDKAPTFIAPLTDVQVCLSSICAVADLPIKQ